MFGDKNMKVIMKLANILTSKLARGEISIPDDENELKDIIKKKVDILIYNNDSPLIKLKKDDVDILSDIILYSFALLQKLEEK